MLFKELFLVEIAIEWKLEFVVMPASNLVYYKKLPIIFKYGINCYMFIPAGHSAVRQY